MKLSLIPEWRRAWRMLSVRFSLAAVAWLALPEAQQTKVLSLLPWLTADQIAGLLIVLSVFGRQIAQPKVRE